MRPAHGLVALHGADVVPVQRAGPERRPRRRTAIASRPRPRPITLRDADSYAAQLRDEGAVIAGFAERRAEIVRQLDAAAAAGRA